MAEEEPTEEPAEEPQVEGDGDPEVEDIALGLADLPADLVGAKKDAKKGANRGRPRGNIGTIIEPHTFYAVINHDEGTALLYNEYKAGRVEAKQTNYVSEMKRDTIPHTTLVRYTDCTFRIFRCWDNIVGLD
eukprot:g3512.t1